MGISVLEGLKNRDRAYTFNVSPAEKSKLKSLFGLKERDDKKGMSLERMKEKEIREELKRLLTSRAIFLLDDAFSELVSFFTDSPADFIEFLYLMELTDIETEDDLYAIVKVRGDNLTDLIDLALKRDRISLWKDIEEVDFLWLVGSLRHKLKDYPLAARLLARGIDTSEIADIMKVSPYKVNYYRNLRKEWGDSKVLGIVTRILKWEFLFKSGLKEEKLLKKEMYLYLGDLYT